MLKCFGFIFILLVILGVPFWGGGVSVIFMWDIMTGVSNGTFISFLLDPLSLGFGVALSLVVWQVSSYSFGYMASSGNLKLFYGPLSVFVLSMFILIFVPDFVLFFMAWDGLGISSFLLVVFYSSGQSAGAGLITVLVNRFGDGCFLMGLIPLVGDFDFSLSSPAVGMSSLFFIMASFSKSAQWPLSSWLPAAMAAPTPISSLVHSSTLVTAGVFLSLRVESGIWFLMSNMVWIPCLTLVLASLSACLSFDLKRIIAMSTLGHLSLMFVALMSGGLTLGFFHLISHAVFKSLLFMAGGNAISISGHSQDIRDMGGVGSSCSLTMGGVFLGLGSLGGVPFMAGFFSKDGILEMVSLSFHEGGGSNFMLLVSFPLSLFYCCRIFWFLAMVGGNVNVSYVGGTVYLVGPLMIMGAGSVLAGWLMEFMVIVPGIGSGWVDSMWLFGLMGVGLIGFGVSIWGGSGIKGDYHGLNNLCYLRAPIHILSGGSMWYSLLFMKSVEHGWLEFVGPQGFSDLGKLFSTRSRVMEW